MTEPTPQAHGPTSKMDPASMLSESGPLRITVDDEATLYADLLANLSKVVHSVNNPLSIISGHAQLLMELSHSEGLDPEIVGYLQNIEEASQRLVVELDRLRDVRGEVRPNDVGGDGV